MVAATPTQLNNVADALKKLNIYIADLQAAQHKAALDGNLSLVQQLSGSFWDANALEEKLVSIRTMTDIAALNNVITSVKRTTSTLKNQKNQIDKIVKAAGITANVINAITTVVAAVATL